VTPSAAPRYQRRRLIAARVLTVLGIVVGVVGTLATYVRYEALDKHQFRQTSRELIADDTIRNQVAATLVERLYANVDVAAQLQQRLPKDQKPLAGPIAAGLRVASDRFAQQLLARPRIQAVWLRAASVMQQRLVDVIHDRTALTTSGGKTVLDLDQLVSELTRSVGLGDQVRRRLPASAGQITILRSNQLEQVQDAVRVLEFLASWLWVVVLALWAGAIWLAAGYRRREVRAIAIGFVAVGILLLVVRSVTGRYVVDSLVASETVRPAARDAWSILTRTLADQAWTLLAVGLVALLGVWLVGPGLRARETLRALAPYLRSGSFAYTTFGVLWILLLWWGPTVQLRRPLDLFLLLVVSGLGLEVLRRIAVRRHPELDTRDTGAALSAAWRRLRERTAPPSAPATTAMAQVEGLDRLARLKQEGMLTEDEFATAKEAILSR
jgi:hypothetical protein